MNELATISDIERMAVAVAKSGLFGVKTTDQAIALMLIAQAEGRHPALAARDYDIIQGRPAKKSEAMMRDFMENGGKVEWHELTDIVADATFSHPSGGTVRISWDMKRAAVAGLGAKDMWKKYTRQMLRSRTISEGIRTVCPMATSGMYVPEEVHDIVKEKDITPAKGVISATTGAKDNLTAEQVQKIDALAQKMTGYLNSGEVEYALLERDNTEIDNDEKVYLWSLFDSTQRSAMKKEAKRLKDISTEKAQKDAIAKTNAANKISDSQKKRLEARIGEFHLDRENVKKYCKDQYGVDHFTELTVADYEDLDLTLESMAKGE